MLEILKSLFGILALSSKTTLYLNANRGVEITGGTAVNGGVTVQGIELTDSSNSTSQWFEFIGAGMGAGIGLPLSGSFSDESFDTWGGTIYKGPAGFGKINFDDITGQGHVFSLSASVLEVNTKGIGLSIVTMGEVGGEPLLCSAFTIFAGTMITPTGVGAMGYKGIWRKVEK